MTITDPHAISDPLAAMDLLLASITRGDQGICIALVNRARHMITQPSDNPGWSRSWQGVIDRWEASALSRPPADRPRYPRLSPEAW